MKDSKKLNIAYIGGGSRGWAWGLMSDLAIEPDLCGQVRLYDIDQQAARDNEIIGNRLSQSPKALSHWEYIAVPTLREALSGADFVIISILPGTFDEMESDVHAPEKYGIYQPVGDTVGPGGLIRALRTIPMYIDIAKAIRDHSPRAWVINYTNPMTLCVRTLYEVFPEVKAVGCCHEVFGAHTIMMQALRNEGIQVENRHEININPIGINHFTWIDSASYKGMNVMPSFLDYAKRHACGSPAKAGEGTPDDDEKYFSCNDKVKFDLFLRYGIYASAGDRHLAEFCPGQWYLSSPEAVERWGFALTPVSYRKQDQQRRIERAKRLKSGEESFELERSGEEGVSQIKALLGLCDLRTNVNIPNAGQIKDIPLGAVVESNAEFSLDGVRPVLAGRMPEPVLGLTMRHVCNQESTLAAVMQNDPQLAFAAFVNDPLVTIGLSDARELFTTMQRNTGKYLPEAFRI